MPPHQIRRPVVFRKLSRQLSKLGAKPAPETVHKFRTIARRAEVLLDEANTKSSHNSKKLRKLLAGLRKKAGNMRDLDVQIALLRNLKIPESAKHKTQLLRTLSEERERREKKLATAFDKQTIRELRKRLERASGDFAMPATPPLHLAIAVLSPLAHDAMPLTEKTLHGYRIAGKRARYLAELDDKNPAARRLVEYLKRMQDVIGDWHDWLKLTQRAEELLGKEARSPLVAALRNITRAKFRQAGVALAEARSTLFEKRPVAVESRRSSAATTSITSAVA